MKGKTTYYCTDCGNETPKWLGKCPACNSWNTIVEQPVTEKSKGVGPKAVAAPSRIPKRLSELNSQKEMRYSTGLGELDRVLGGGAVTGSLVLVGGAPGIGKSTLLLQICGFMGRRFKILYVSGEESEYQLKMRADRLSVTSDTFYVQAETELPEILSAAESLEPEIMIIDSIQTLYNPDMNSSPGSVGQVKECAMALLKLSKSRGVTVFLIGHVNKEGAIAGPKVLEHMVDCVLYFEGESSGNYRILRSAKNRFGSTNELGVFEMQEGGLVEVPNPSELLLSGRPSATPGTCVTCVMEGSRPIMAEVQALVATSFYNVPRRNSNGVEYNRAMMLLAVLEKRGGLRVSGCDAYINVIGGLNLDEPAADLAVILSLASSFRDTPAGDDIVAIGEVGLTGELRSVTQMNQRLTEAARLGFGTCIVPKNSIGKITVPAKLKIVSARTIAEAIALAIG